MSLTNHKVFFHAGWCLLPDDFEGIKEDALFIMAQKYSDRKDLAKTAALNIIWDQDDIDSFNDFFEKFYVDFAKSVESGSETVSISNIYDVMMDYEG